MEKEKQKLRDARRYIKLGKEYFTNLQPLWAIDNYKKQKKYQPKPM
jgi:hypothetical protein